MAFPRKAHDPGFRVKVLSGPDHLAVIYGDLRARHVVNAASLFPNPPYDGRRAKG